MRTASVVGALLIAIACGAAPSNTRVADEIARLEQTLKSIPAADVPEDVRDLFEAHHTSLERAKKATSPEYKLYRLRDPFVGIETLAFVAREKNSSQSVDTFHKLWLANQARFEAKQPKARGSLLQRGLIESATTRAERYFHASLPYAKASAPWSGVYYLGEAEGNLRFRAFVQSLAGDSSEKAPARERLAALLDNLERDTLAFFGSDVTNQAAVPVSVRLKETHELLDAGRVDGATLLLVESRAALSRRGGPHGNYPALAKPTKGSIAAVIEAWSADEPAPMNGLLKTDVAPFYGAMFQRGTPRKETRAAQVRVTLVRWPYT